MRQEIQTLTAGFVLTFSELWGKGERGSDGERVRQEGERREERRR